MRQNAAYKRIILGLKVKEFRRELGLSQTELSQRSGLSASYINEIEKGKKFPKEDKVVSLASALKTSPEALLSSELSKHMAPLEGLLRSNFLNDLPLDLFGIDVSKVVEIIAHAPAKVGAFISTLLEISRNYALRTENFYFSAMRAYQELHNNYFKELEEAVDRFQSDFGLAYPYSALAARLEEVLQTVYQVDVRYGNTRRFPALSGLRSVYNSSSRVLLVNEELSENQRTFQLAKELGFHYLECGERAATSRLLSPQSFDQVLSHNKATYFATALLVDRASFLRDVDAFFSKTSWKGASLMHLMVKYGVSPEILYQRFSNLLPQYFGLEKVFFFRLSCQGDKPEYHIDNELHLSRRHKPHGNKLLEHYCRRWLSVGLLNDLQEIRKKGQYVGAMVGAQRSTFYGSEEEYLSLAIARGASAGQGRSSCINMGIMLDETARRKIRFLEDPSVERKVVNITCERCAIQECQERVAPPSIVQRMEERKQQQVAVEALIKKLK